MKKGFLTMAFLGATLLCCFGCYRQYDLSRDGAFILTLSEFKALDLRGFSPVMMEDGRPYYYTRRIRNDGERSFFYSEALTNQRNESLKIVVDYQTFRNQAGAERAFMGYRLIPVFGTHHETVLGYSPFWDEAVCLSWKGFCQMYVRRGRLCVFLQADFPKEFAAIDPEWLSGVMEKKVEAFLRLEAASTEAR